MSKKSNATEISAPEYVAEEEIDKPLPSVGVALPRDPNITRKQMSEKDKTAWNYGSKIIIGCFAMLLILIVVDVMLSWLEIEVGSGILSSTFELTRTAVLLVLAFMFGNQSKE